MAEQKLIGTGLTAKETNLLDAYLLSFITIREYLKRADAAESTARYKRAVLRESAVVGERAE